VIENLITAYQFIFEYHPNSEAIMEQIIDGDRRVTVNQFQKWYAEALEAK
jgi:hypothetical protein